MTINTSRPAFDPVRWLPIIAIVVTGFLLYSQTISFDYTYLDDNEIILNNLPILQKLSNFFYAFQEDVFFSYNDAYYRPMLTASFILDAAWGGGALWAFHITNIAIHVVCAILVFYLFLQLRHRRSVATLFALLFTVHPVLTQAVAWAPGRNDSLVTLFVLTAFMLFIRYVQETRWPFLLGHWLAFCAALFTKETGLLTMGLCLFYGFLLTAKRPPARFWLRWLPGCAVAVFLYYLMRSAALQHPVSYTMTAIVGSLWKNIPAVLQYFGKLFFPFNLSVYPTMMDSVFYYGVLALLLFLFLTLRSKKTRWSLWAFGLLWFMLFLLPSFIQPDPNVTAIFMEHRLHFPIIGFFLALAELDFIKELDLSLRKPVVFALALLGVAMGLTVYVSRNFSDRMKFWQTAAGTSVHSPLAQRNLGAMYYLNGQKEPAAFYFQKSLALNPYEPMANMNLGLIAMEQKQFNRAESLYTREIAINPNFDLSYLNLGLLYHETGHWQIAIRAFKKALSLNQNSLNSYLGLAVVYYEHNRVDSARFCLQMAQQRGFSIPANLAQAIGLP
jgi:protein O-mannosyl-transferase